MDYKTHNDALAKIIQKKLKKDLPNTETMRQGYKGTGSKSHRRQIFLRRTDGTPLDLWLEEGRITLGTLYHSGTINFRFAFRVDDRTPEESYAELITQLRDRGW